MPTGPEKRRVPTARDVAERVGVSTATVSLVVNGKADGRVTAATEQRVWAAVRELDYRVHAGASRLATGNPGNVVFVSPDPTNPFFSMLLEGLLDGLDERLSLSLAAPHGGDDYDPQAVRRALSGDIAALVLASPGDEALRELRPGRPTVLIDSGSRPAGIASIDVDIPAAARMLAEHVAELGHRRLAYVGVDRAKPTLRKRREQLGRLLGAYGAVFAVPDVAVQRMSMDDAHRAASAAVGSWRDAGVTAVICADDLLAFGTMRAARERGLTVPGDLSVAGFNDMPYAGMVTPSLTSVDLRARDLGRGTALLLHEVIWGKGPSRAQLQPRLSVRESTGPAR